MAFQPNQIVLVDTNVILEAHRTGCWAPISQYFDLHTVDKVIEETQTGFQNRSIEQTIDEAALRASFSNIATINNVQRATFNLAHNHPTLDDGEGDLLVYAVSLPNTVWFLNSPDMAAVRFVHGRGWIDRLVSLEVMASHLKARLGADLRNNYTERWLSGKRTNLILGA